MKLTVSQFRAYQILISLSHSVKCQKVSHCVTIYTLTYTLSVCQVSWTSVEEIKVF